MSHTPTPLATTLALWALLLALPAAAQHHGHQGHAAPADTRQAVNFPQPMKDGTLANMRDHLLALAQIQDK
ncbi:MAG: hypothetical protein RLZZ271_1311, partial [Pseudomonadota bacterium]